jgi:hypothetical protein
MIVQGTEIPESVVKALTAYIVNGSGPTAGAIEVKATSLLLVEGITDPDRNVPHRLADRLIQKLRANGQIHFVREGRQQRWFPTGVH